MLVSLISRLVACSLRIVVDKQTDRHRTTTVTLAAHARRGLMNAVYLTVFTAIFEMSKKYGGKVLGIRELYLIHVS